MKLAKKASGHIILAPGILGCNAEYIDCEGALFWWLLMGPSYFYLESLAGIPRIDTSVLLHALIVSLLSIVGGPSAGCQLCTVLPSPCVAVDAAGTIIHRAVCSRDLRDTQCISLNIVRFHRYSLVSDFHGSLVCSVCITKKLQSFPLLLAVPVFVQVIRVFMRTV